MRFRLALTVVMLLTPGYLAARDVQVGIGLSISPYVIPDELRGMEYDIAKEALALEGHEMKPVFMPLGRVMKSLERGHVDAALTQRPDQGGKLAFSQVYITYRNYAITLASRNIKVERFDDLSGKSVLAFQNATHYLGPEFKKVADGNPHYREEATQVVQPLLLFLGRVDVVIADRNIFGWFSGLPEVKAKVDTTQAIRYHAIFPPTDYRMAFADPALRDSFDHGLAKLRASGEYTRILARYSPLMTEENR
ncbi:MAG: transporter substrate-binding domain-containing protein [Magnetospirillum sp.]|nr:transporter substrate-binding domain-containing protein [Magnetospirillum sp.]